MLANASPFETARLRGRSLLTEVEAKTVVQAAGIATSRTVLTTSPQEAARVAAEMGFPVVLKVVSAEVTHKSDSGGVRLNLQDPSEVEAAYQRILDDVQKHEPGASIEGVSVQRMVTEGIEIIVGGVCDPQFGPVVAFGLGGVWVEILEDVTFRVLPIERSDAAEMIREIQGFPLLNGVRGQPPADLTAIEDVILGVASLMERHPDIESLDLNPVIVGPSGAVAVDARVLLSPDVAPNAASVGPATTA